MQEHSVCGESLLNPHDCYDSDGFSDTTIGSEFMESSTVGETDTTGTEVYLCYYFRHTDIKYKQPRIDIF